jgi:hypothetical protein
MFEDPHAYGFTHSTRPPVDARGFGFHHVFIAGIYLRRETFDETFKADMLSRVEAFFQDVRPMLSSTNIESFAAKTFFSGLRVPDKLFSGGPACDHHAFVVSWPVDLISPNTYNFPPSLSRVFHFYRYPINGISFAIENALNHCGEAQRRCP